MPTLQDLQGVAWLRPWSTLSPDARTPLERELAREVCPRHALAERRCTAVAVTQHRDDVLFLVDDGRLAVVHLTWSVEKDPAWPAVRFFSTLQAFEHVMREQHADFF